MSFRCPTCKRPVPEPPESQPLPPHFPFCGDRCKLVDLGRWLDGKYQIPVSGDDDGGEAPPADPDRP